MSSIQYVGDVLSAFADIFQPLEDSLGSGAGLSAFLADFGWSLDPKSDANTIAAAFGSLPSLFKAVRDAVTALESANSSGQDSGIVDAVSKLSVAIKNLVTAISALTSASPNSTWPPPLNTQLFWQIFPLELLDYLLYRYLQNQTPKLFACLRLIGVLSEDNVIPLVTGRISYVRRGLRWDHLTTLVTEPQNLLSDVYGWGGALEAQRLLENLRAVGLAFGLSAVIREPSHDLMDAYYDQGATSRQQAIELSIPVYWEMSEIGKALTLVMIELAALPIPPADKRGASAVGLALYPRVTGNVTDVIQITDSLSLQVKGGFISEAAIRAEIRPSGVNIFIDPTLSGQINAAAIIDAKPATPWIPIGEAGSSRLELRHAHGAFKATGNVPDIEFIIELAADDAAVIIQFDEGDGFLGQLLGGSPKTVSLSLSLTWSSKRGLQLGGQAQLTVTIPVHASILGVIDFDSLTIGFGASATPPGVALAVSVTGGLDLGPIAAVVDQVGAQAILAFVPPGQPPGNLGAVDLTWAFLPPKGLGLSIDAGVVSGGGFILFDPVKGEYAGFLDISIVDIIQVIFIAILDTKMPDGSKGFSFLFIIFMELPPIQLGFGFTLNGIGGIAGVNRGLSPDGLIAGIHNHTLDYLISPPHTIADAPKVITAVNSFFPIAQGRYIFGPIVSVGWETFVQLTVGVILSIPDPIIIAILGIFDLCLPTIEDPEAALVKIHVDVLGIIDFGKQKLSVDGSMYDSSLLEFPLLGDFALRSSWGASKSSLVSFGGWNPHFDTTGLDVPQLHRFSITISNGDNPVISANAYLASTSNTIQFGANVQASLHAGDFAVQGYLGFDLLVVIQWPTVSFEFDFAANLNISYKGNSLAGINVTGKLTGTTPWHVHADASFNILCFSVGASVDLTWGDSILPALLGIFILPDLLPPFLDPLNWLALLPDNATLSVTLSAPTVDKQALVVHPMGALSVREKVVPLGLAIAQYKNGTPSDGTYFAMGDVLINGTKVSTGTHKDYFAPGQFLNLSDADKLSRPSFELYDAGAQISSANVASGANSNRTVTYKESIIVDLYAPLRPTGTYAMPADEFHALSYQSSGFSAKVKNSGLGKYKFGSSTPAATTSDPPYVVTSVDDLSVRSDIVGGGGTTYYQARAALNAHLGKNPGDAGNLQIMPAHEVTP
jgi:hypothetical protein